jgi:hypothetical protein
MVRVEGDGGAMSTHDATPVVVGHVPDPGETPFVMVVVAPAAFAKAVSVPLELKVKLR